MATRREEQMKCLDPAYARKRELEKPVYRWTVSASWYGLGERGGVVRFQAEQSVVAKNEGDAWAMFCHHVGCSKGRRQCDVEIKQGKRVPVEDALAGSGGQDPGEIPVVTLGKKKVGR